MSFNVTLSFGLSTLLFLKAMGNNTISHFEQMLKKQEARSTFCDNKPLLLAARYLANLRFMLGPSHLQLIP